MPRPQHSPGPWTEQDAMIFAGTLKIADCLIDYDDETVISDATIEANARLIAAAPEMLSVLETIYARLGDLLDSDEVRICSNAGEDLEDLQNAIFTIIATATKTTEQPQ